MLEMAVLAAFLAFCRIGACMMLMPGLGSARVPMQVRLFLAVSVSLALLVHLWEAIAPHVSRPPSELLLLIASELALGALIGLVVRFYVLALQFIGSAITMLSGFGLAAADVAVEEIHPPPAMAAIISLAALMLLFALDFHHAIFRALIASYELAPVSVLFDPRSALIDLSDTLSEAFFVMIRLGSPFVAYAILVNLAVGFLNKLAPQIPLYFISLPFVIAGGLILLYFGIGTFLALFADGFIPTTLGR